MRSSATRTSWSKSSKVFRIIAEAFEAPSTSVIAKVIQHDIVWIGCANEDREVPRSDECLSFLKSSTQFLSPNPHLSNSSYMSYNRIRNCIKMTMSKCLWWSTFEWNEPSPNKMFIVCKAQKATCTSIPNVWPFVVVRPSREIPSGMFSNWKSGNPSRELGPLDFSKRLWLYAKVMLKPLWCSSFERWFYANLTNS
jgi:hypothetical protein